MAVAQALRAQGGLRQVLRLLAPWSASQARALSSEINGIKGVDLGTQDERESMHYDVCVVGAGPAGLSAAIRFKQLCKEKDKDYSICVLEKGAEIGAHILSGNVLEPRALDELLPDWRSDPECPISSSPATGHRFYLLGRRTKLRLPNPPQMRTKGNYVISLSEAVRWLGSRAEALGAELYPGFAGARIVYGKDGSVHGVQSGDFGVARDGSHKPGFTLGMALTARATLLAEGCRGSLSQEAMKHFGLRGRVQAQPQTYALGLKELWEVSLHEQVAPHQHNPGLVTHTVGWPLPWNVYGGSFIYHLHGPGTRVALGLVVALDYADPYLNLYEEFQQFKRHPMVAHLLKGGACLQYGARTLNEGGWQSVPGLAFPGGALLGDSAGLLNVPKIKGTHTAMKSGMLAAEAAFAALEASPGPHSQHVPLDLSAYEAALRESWVGEELRAVRNLRPGFGLGGGLALGLAHAALATYVLRGKEPWTLRHRRADHEALRPAAEFSPRDYPKPDGVTTFDLAASLYRSGTAHEHDQPPHLKLRNPKVPAAVNLPIYAGPEARYCPAGVYEYVADERGTPRLAINAQNCLHCKACDIKDPTQNIQWTVPEGGGGPVYTQM